LQKKPLVDFVSFAQTLMKADLRSSFSSHENENRGFDKKQDFIYKLSCNMMAKG